MKSSIYLLVFLLAFCSGCGKKDGEGSGQSTDSKGNQEQRSSRGLQYSEDESPNQQIEDGTYSASVYYDNPKTGYSETYDLEVEVEDGCVTTIYFPKGGQLDEDHFDAAELDADGNAEVNDDEGRTFSVHIEK